MGTGATPTDGLSVVARARARAEHAEWAALLDHHETEVARIEASGVTALRALVERSAIALDVGQATGLSEGQVVSRVAAARLLHDAAPTAWTAFGEGRLDAARAREVVGALQRLERPESRARLDEQVVAYADGRTVAELRAWLRRLVARLEPDLATERAEREREARHVEVVHTDDSMAWLNAYLPSHVAAAIDRRLTREARALPADGRTLPQRRADLLAAWATTSEAESARPVVDVAVTIDAPTLTGAATDGHAEAADGSWTVPAAWVLEHAGSAFWHRLLVDPGTGDVLSHQYVGRFAPELLARAIALRDGTCRAPGCLRPAPDCDVDHRRPWPAGPTAGDNLWALCRRHHTLKGHDVLQWVLPSGRVVDAA